MNINEEQNRAKLIKLRKRHLIVKQRFYKSFGIQYRLHLHFYLLWKDRIAGSVKVSGRRGKKDSMEIDSISHNNQSSNNRTTGWLLRSFEQREESLVCAYRGSNFR